MRERQQRGRRRRQRAWPGNPGDVDGSVCEMSASQGQPDVNSKQRTERAVGAQGTPVSQYHQSVMTSFKNR